MTEVRWREYSESIGESRCYKVNRRDAEAQGENSSLRLGDSAVKTKCICSPSLADLCQDAFACGSWTRAFA